MLHILGIAGGWPRALIAQQVFRHKSNRASSQIVDWLAVFANIGVRGWSLTTHGAQIIRELLIGLTRGC